MYKDGVGSTTEEERFEKMNYEEEDLVPIEIEEDLKRIIEGGCYIDILPSDPETKVWNIFDILWMVLSYLSPDNEEKYPWGWIVKLDIVLLSHPSHNKYLINVIVDWSSDGDIYVNLTCLAVNFVDDKAREEYGLSVLV